MVSSVVAWNALERVRAAVEHDVPVPSRIDPEVLHAFACRDDPLARDHHSLIGVSVRMIPQDCTLVPRRSCSSLGWCVSAPSGAAPDRALRTGRRHSVLAMSSFGGRGAAASRLAESSARDGGGGAGAAGAAGADLPSGRALHTVWRARSSAQPMVGEHLLLGQKTFVRPPDRLRLAQAVPPSILLHRQPARAVACRLIRGADGDNRAGAARPRKISRRRTGIRAIPQLQARSDAPQTALSAE